MDNSINMLKKCLLYCITLHFVGSHSNTKLNITSFFDVLIVEL